MSRRARPHRRPKIQPIERTLSDQPGQSAHLTVAAVSAAVGAPELGSTSGAVTAGGIHTCTTARRAGRAKPCTTRDRARGLAPTSVEAALGRTGGSAGHPCSRSSSWSTRSTGPTSSRRAARSRRAPPPSAQVHEADIASVDCGTLLQLATIDDLEPALWCRYGELALQVLRP